MRTPAKSESATKSCCKADDEAPKGEKESPASDTTKTDDDQLDEAPSGTWLGLSSALKNGP